MTQTVAHNVLTGPTKTVYLNEPMNKQITEEENKTEPQDTPESVEPTPASNTQEETYKKRYDDLKGHYDRTKASYDAQLAELKTQVGALTDKAVTEKITNPQMPKTPEEWKAFSDKYPELAAMITTAAMMATANTSSVVAEKLKLLEEKQNALSAREGVVELKKYHPDFETIKDDPRFIEWFGMQTSAVKALIQSSNVKDIALGLDKFKEYAGIKTQSQKAEAKKDATRDVKTPTGRVQIGEGQKRTYTNAEIYKMPMSEFEKLQDDIKAAQYDGRIVS